MRKIEKQRGLYMSKGKIEALEQHKEQNKEVSTVK